MEVDDKTYHFRAWDDTNWILIREVTIGLAQTQSCGVKWRQIVAKYGMHAINPTMAFVETELRKITR